MNEGTCVRGMGAGHSCPFCGGMLGLTVFDAETAEPKPGLQCENDDFECVEDLGE